MVIAIDTEDREKFEGVSDCAQTHDLASDFRQIGLVFALIVASLLCFLSINDIRTSLSLLHSAASCWPKTMGWSLHSLTRGCA